MRRKHLKLAALILSTALCTQLGVSTFAASGFDPVFYAATYPDIAAAYGNDEGAMLLHYLHNTVQRKAGSLPPMAFPVMIHWNLRMNSWPKYGLRFL